MACLLVPVAEAVVTTIASKAMESKEKKAAEVKFSTGEPIAETAEKIPFSRKLKWLSNLLWGGSILLLLEHIWHGEIVPWFPFLTAAGNPADTLQMLREMATVGVSMTVIVTAVWVGMLAVVSAMEKRASKAKSAETAEV